MRLVIILLFCLLFLLRLPAQSPYELSGKREGALIGSGLLFNGASFYLNGKYEILQPSDIMQLDTASIPGIDRWVTRQYSLGAKRSSDVALFSSLALPLLMLADRPSRSDFGKVGLLTFETLLLNGGLTNLTKTTVRRPRPFLYNSDVPIELKLRKSSSYSFFSGHTSTTAAMSFLTASLYQDYYPDSNIKPLVWGVAAAIPTFTGIQRIRAGKHFVTDVLVGYAVGALVGVLVPAVHR